MDKSVTLEKWFHKPNEEHPEIPDLTIPRLKYKIHVDNIKDFLSYNGEEIDFKDRYIKGHLVKFICPIYEFIIHGRIIGVSLIHDPDMLLLLDKLQIYNIKHLRFESLRIHMTYLNLNPVLDNKEYPIGNFDIKIESLSFHECSAGTEFLDFWTKSNRDNGIEYRLKYIEFTSFGMTYKDIEIIHKNMRTNYVLLGILWRAKTEQPDCEFSSSLKPQKDKWKSEVDVYLKRNQDAYERCRTGTFLPMFANRYSRENVFNILPVDVVRIISRLIWNSRGMKIWIRE